MGPGSEAGEQMERQVRRADDAARTRWKTAAPREIEGDPGAVASVSSPWMRVWTSLKEKEEWDRARGDEQEEMVVVVVVAAAGDLPLGFLAHGGHMRWRSSFTRARSQEIERKKETNAVSLYKIGFF